MLYSAESQSQQGVTFEVPSPLPNAKAPGGVGGIHWVTVIQQPCHALGVGGKAMQDSRG